MKKFKQLLLTTLVLFCSTLTTWAETTFENEEGTLKFTVTNEEKHYVSVEKGSTLPEDDLVIEATVTNPDDGEDYIVKTIPEKAFIDCSGLTSVTVPNSVTRISSGAFSGCSGLTKITLPFVGEKQYTADDEYQYPLGHIFGTDNYTGGTATTQYYLGAYAFSYTNYANKTYCIPTTLEEVVITDNCTYIQYGAFSGCSGLTKITLPFVGDRARTKESSTHLPFGYIFGTYSYTGGTATKQRYGYSTNSTTNTYYIPTSLKEVVITSSSHIPFCAFQNCSGLTQVTIPNSVTSIGWSAFENCSSLTSITIPQSVTSIDNNAFKNCSNAMAFVFEGETPPSFGIRVFDGTTSLILVPSTEAASAYKVVDNIQYYYNERITMGSLSAIVEIDGFKYLLNETDHTAIVFSNHNSGKVDIPAEFTYLDNNYSVTAIGPAAFQDCSGLTSITIPESITSIGDYAFSGCTGLSSISMSESITSIGKYAFNNCSSLTQVTIPNSATYIGISAFSGCNGLTKITLPFVGSYPYTTSGINQYPFGHIFGTSEYTGGKKTTQCYYYNANKTTTIVYYIPESLKEVVITGSSQSSYIPFCAFWNCSGLTSVIIGNSVTSIGEQAFAECSGLTSVTIPNSVTSIGKQAFEDCSGLTSAIIGNSVTSIGAFAFRRCDHLTSVNIPNSVTSIGNSAFYDCANVEEFVFERETPPSFGTNVFEGSTCPIYVPSTTAATAYKAAANMSAYASRITPHYLITVAANYNDYGSVSGSGSYRPNTKVILTAQAAENCRFISWNDGEPNTSREITVTDDETYTAIFKRILTVSNIAANNKVYDGTATAIGTFTTDELEDDDVTISYTAAFADKKVEENKQVTFNFTKSGNDADKYVFENATDYATAKITPKDLTVSNIVASGKVYDGTTAAVITYAFAGVLENDEVEVSYTANFADKNVGENKNVTFNFEKSGFDAANYVFVPEQGTATANITPKNVTLEWGETSLTYNGLAQKPTATASGMVNDESMVVTVSGEQTNADTYTATASITDNNYKLPDNVTKEFTITPKDVELVWENTELTYNGSAQKPTATATGMVNNESLAVTVSGEQTNANTNTETYTATASITDNNYKLPDDATKEFTINPKDVTLEWGESTFTYNGEAQKPTATASGMVNDESLAVTVSGEQTNADTYTASASITDSNYKLPEDATKEFTINPKEVTLEWGESTFTYNGEAQKPTATATGMVNDESLAVTVSGEQTNAGTYTATASITDNNYKLPEDATKEFTINPKEVTLEWSNTSFTYNGEAQAPTATATGLIEGDVCTVTVSGAQINAGTAYTVTATALSNANYKLPNAVTATFSIGKATPSYTKPENLTINCKQTLADITLPAGFAFENENAALKIGGNTVTVSFTPEDVDNYNVVSGIEVKVTKAHSAVTDVAVPATCTTDGLTEGSHCSVCHAVFVAQEVIPAGHTAGAAVAENLKAATCTEAGLVDSVVYCTVCKEELSRKTVELTVIPHTPGEVVAKNLKAATCTEAGSVDSVVYCTVCNAEVSRKTVEIHATGHTAGETVAENLKAATCTEAGSVDSVVYCTVCKAELSRKTVELPATGHTEVVDAAVAATCTESGLTEGSHCSVCNAIIKAQEVIPATGHKADSIAIENVVAATYTAAGSYDSVVYCSVCKVELSRTKVEIPQLVAPKVDAEVVISQLDYTVGDSLKLDGGKLIITTSDSTTAEIVITPDMIKGFNPDSVGVQQVTVEFTVNNVVYTTTFEVEVKEAVVIEVVAKSVALSAPTKVVYKKGEQLDVAGGKLIVTYSDGTTQDVDLKADMVSGFNTEKVGAQQLTVTLKIDEVVLTATFEVTVEADDNTAISDDEAAAVNIYAYQNVIVVESADALEGEISIFDVNGRMVAKELAAGSRTEIMMQNQGIYIVKVNNTAKRVMVY